MARVLFVVGIAVILASCSAGGPPLAFKKSKEFFSEREYGRASPRVVANATQPVPKGGGRAMVGNAYQVAGKTYVPQANPDGYSATGLASWYGSAFHGRLTANGEVYDVAGLTAAHPTLPLPSYARVTNLQNGRSIVVRINDRGPFAEGRLIDVSERVADVLDFRTDGTAKVRVDYVGPARMDGLDDRMLAASYRDSGGGFGGGTTQFALATPPRPAARPPVVLAAAAPAPKLRPSVAPVQAFTSDAIYRGDPLGPLILETAGFTSSYATAPVSTPAQQAIDTLTSPPTPPIDLQAALMSAVARRADELGLKAHSAVVRLGAFADASLAARAANGFAEYGAVESRSVTGTGGRTLTVVELKLDPAADANAAIAAAAKKGLRAQLLD